MKLFEIDPDDKTVELNKAWIMMIPEFAELFKRDKGSPSDHRGLKKLKTRKELTFIYFYMDFSSPIRDLENEKRYEESLYYADLKAEDIDAKVKTAMDKYYELMLGASRSLRTLKSLYKGMDAMDSYFENVNFDAKDKLGRLLNDPSSFVTDVGKMDKMYDAIKNFEKRVEQDLKEDTGIRGTATLGDKETGRRTAYSESDIVQGSDHVKGSITAGNSFNSMLEQMKVIAAKEVKEKPVTAAIPSGMRDIFGEEDNDI